MCWEVKGWTERGGGGGTILRALERPSSARFQAELGTRFNLMDVNEASES